MILHHSIQIVENDLDRFLHVRNDVLQFLGRIANELAHIIALCGELGNQAENRSWIDGRSEGAMTLSRVEKTRRSQISFVLGVRGAPYTGRLPSRRAISAAAANQRK